ncbi:tryptophan 2,3-dioxygenase family protein [Micromonospora haikouensis]|uniref:tryptophan 2,3-dioxygenase family protein n=1 Tax=Micromonospora haikouensis TaxID=686309 RepID=UPI0036867B9B
MTSAEPLHRWLAQRRLTAATFPYAAVVDAYQRHGKHFVPDEWTRLLAAARDRLTEGSGAQGRRLNAFLAVALDKADGRYDYRTYLALSLLPLPDIGDAPAPAARLLAHRDRLHVHLLTDLIRFELTAANDTAPLPQLRPEPARAAKRIRHALRAAMPALRRLSLIAPAVGGDPDAMAWQAVAAVEVDTTAEERLALRVSMLPVSTIHDEWMFIRVLQTFEVTFALLAVDLRAVVAAVRAGHLHLAATRMSAAAALLRDSAPLWSVTATLQPEAFHRFRPYTEGASAIQSRHYKLVESLCRTPDASRRDSPAYLSTPDVRALILRGQASVDDALDALAPANAAGHAQPALATAMAEFTVALRRWRRTHYRLALRMLGTDQTGTGYTQGIPYLARACAEPVFRCRSHTNPSAKDDR